MPEMISKPALMLMMEKRAAYDSQPRACRRMMGLVQSFPAEPVVPRDVFLLLLETCRNNGSLTQQEADAWKRSAGLM